MSAADTMGPHVFLARMESASTAARLLEAIKMGDTAMVVITATGVKVLVEYCHTVQARAFLQEELFQEYSFTPDAGSQEVAEFRIDLKIMLECMTVFGTGEHVAMRLAYEGYGYPLNIVLEEGGVVTDCSIKTLEPEALPDMNIINAVVPCNIIMKSKWLGDVFQQMDTSSDTLHFTISPTAPYFCLATRGPAGTSEVQCPKESDVVESFTCSQPLQAEYKMKLIKPSERALRLSTKVSIRINVEGMLSMQFLIETEDGNTTFLEYLFQPMEEQN